MEIWVCVLDGALAGAFLLAAVWSAWIYRRDGSEPSFLWTGLLALTASAVLAFGAVAISRTGTVTYPASLAARDLLQGVSALIAVRTLVSMVPTLKLGRLMQVTTGVIAVHAVLLTFTDLVVVYPLEPGSWPTYGPGRWISALYGLPPLWAALLAAIRGTAEVRRRLAVVGLLAIAPAVGLAFVSGQLWSEELADLSTAALGIGILGVAAQRMTRIVGRRDLLLRQRVGLTGLARLAVDSPTVELVRSSAERLLGSELRDESIRVRLGESSGGPAESGVLTVEGVRDSVSVLVPEVDEQQRNFAEQVLQIVAGAADRAHAEDEIRHSASHDSLTGLPNRMLFLDRLSGQLGSNTTVVVLCGVRGLDELAAARGHRTRDDVLKAIGDALADTARTDRVLAYLGDGTFALIESISETATDAAVSAQLVDWFATLHTSIATSPAVAGRLRIVLGAALGRDVQADELLRDATAALTRAVEQNHRYQVYDTDLGERLRRSSDTAAQLREALDRDEIEVHYQPVVDTHTRQVTSFEALARWRRAATIIGPALWIPSAEATGLIHEIGLHVLATAARDRARLNASVGVNVSPVQLAADDFADRAIAALGDCPPASIILEITESAVMADLDHAVRQLNTLRAAGIRIALDDFGTSYSSLSVLADLPVDIVKIDQAFVRRMGTAPGLAIVQAIVSMARAVGKTTVAEGVETPEQFTELAALGVDRIQGFLVAEPMVSRRAERWPRRRPLPTRAAVTA